VVVLLVFSSLLVRALVVSTSSRWFNYRHSANAFSFVDMLQLNGVGSSDILLAVADDPAFASRNPFPGQIFASSPFTTDVYHSPNFTGDAVSVADFRSLLTHGPINGKMNRVMPGPDGRFLIYLAGHGGEEFLKFRNVEELRATEFAFIVAEMKRILKFQELVVILDTCQAETFFRHIQTDGVTTIASSKLSEKAVSSEHDRTLGVPLADLFTRALVHTVPKLGRNATFSDLFRALARSRIGSTPVINQSGAPRSPSQMLLRDFFY
jgi:phosphatidylinositol glycan class K